MGLIRRLGVGETWLALLHDKARGTAQTTNMLHLEGPLDFELFQTAVLALYHRYQQLSARLVLTPGGYQLIQDVSFNKVSVQFAYCEYDEEWQTIMQDEANDILNQETVLWRAKLVSSKNQKQHYIFITIHHAISDGLSALALFDTLLFYFNQPENTLPTILLPPPIEVLYQPPLVPQDRKQTLKMIEKLDALKLYQWPHQIPTPIAERTTHFIFSFYNADDLAALLNAVRQQNVTLNSLFNACMLVTAQRLLQLPFNGGLSTPVNLRGFTNKAVSADNVAFLCGVINTKHPDIQANCDFWYLTKQYQQQLHERLSLLTLPSPDYNFLDLSNSMSAIWDPSRNTFCYDYMVTNLGLVNFQNLSQQFTILQLRFGTCRSAGDNNMMLLVSATTHGLFFTFGYPAPLITDSWATNFVREFDAQLKRLLKP